MAGYSVVIKESVLKKDLASIPKGDLQRIVHRIGTLAVNPRPSGCERLSGQDRYRIRQGNYCIIYPFKIWS